MYRMINIDGKDYRMEYTIEASMYHECIERLVNFIFKTSVASAVDVTGLDEKDAVKAFDDATKLSISGMADLPTTAMYLWYAGFLEYHGPEGDGTVTTLRDAKQLYKKYAEQYPEEGSFYSVISMCMEQMSADGFFDRTGINQMLVQAATEAEPKKPKAPQDHKKKATASKTR